MYRFHNPVSIPLITLQYTRVEYELTKLDVISQIDRACSLTKLATGWGEVRARPDFRTDFLGFWGSTRSWSEVGRSVVGRM